MKTLIMIHGRNWKPPEADLRQLWIDALRFGIERDHPDALAAFDQANKEFVYYGDVSNQFLHKYWKKPIPNDTAERRDTLENLKAWKVNQFTKHNYEKLPGKESLKEGIADALSPVLHFLRLSDDLIEVVAPDMGEYWKRAESPFGSRVREGVPGPLMKAIDNGDSICMVSHSLGTMIAYDTMWKFSYMSEYRQYNGVKIDLFVTLGSPLGDPTVKTRLYGSSADGPRRYPTNIRNWVNVAAEDDFVSHDQKISGDYRAMKRHGFVDSIIDYHIYNLSVRTDDQGSDKSNPHHGSGYLIHPRVASTVAAWLNG